MLDRFFIKSINSFSVELKARGLFLLFLILLIKVNSSQFNYQYRGRIHFPYSIGRLVTYAKTNEEVSSNFNFKPTYIFRDKLEECVEKSSDADILLCSCYVWNWEITKQLAKKIKI